MDAKTTKHLLNNLDNVIHYLNKPNISRDEDGIISPIQYTCKERIISIASKVFLYIRRIWNVIFGDHVYYNELKARDIVIFYLGKKIHRSDRTPARARQILEIYEKLRYIADGKSSYAETANDKRQSINSALIERLRNSIGKYEKKKAQENRIDPDKYLLSQEPAEIIPSEPSEAALAHHFNYVKELYAPGAKTVLQVHGNRFANNSQLTNSSSAHTIEYLYSYLEARQKQSPNPIMERFFSKLRETEPLAKALIDYDEAQTKSNADGAYSYRSSEQEMVTKRERNRAIDSFIGIAKSQLEKAAAQNTSLIIPSGWIKATLNKQMIHHDLYLEVFPATGTLRIYNSGPGIEQHNSGIVANKVKYQAYTEWKGIAKDKLLSENFLRAIAEMRLCENVSSKNRYGHDKMPTNYNQNDIYIGLKKILQPTATDEGQKPKNLISKQSAELSSTRGLFAVMRTHLEEAGPEGKAEYKRFKCDLKIQSLIDQILKKSLDNKEMNEVVYARLIEKSLQKTCKSINRLFSKKFAAQHYLDEAHEALTPIKVWVESQREKLNAAQKIEDARFYSQNITITLANPELSLEESAKKGVDAVAPQSGEFVTSKITSWPINIPQAVLKSLNEIVEVGQTAWKEGHDLPLHTGLLHTINKLSTEESFWKEACSGSPEKAKEIIANLGIIAELFFKSCYMLPFSEIVLPERIQALLKIQVVLRRLTAQLGFDLEFNLPGYFGDGITTYVALSSNDNKELHEMKSLRSGYRSFEVGVSRNFSGKTYHLTEGKPNEYFYDHQRESLADIVRKYEPDVAKRAPIANKCVEDGHIYASDSLPKWIECIRNMPIYMYSLLKKPVGKPTLVDRTNAFKFTFEAKENRSSSFGTVSCDVTRTSNINTKEIIDRYPIAKEMHPGEGYFSDYLRDFDYTHSVTAKSEKNILRKVMRHPVHQEKTLLSDNKAHKENEIKMDAEEYQDLRHIFLDRATMIPEALEYFTKNPEKLKSKEYQNLLRVALFQPEVLSEALKRDGIAQAIQNFINRNLEDWTALGEIQGSVFLLQCLRFLNAYDSKRFPDNCLTQLRKLLTLQDLDPEKKSVIYAEIVAYLGHKDPNYMTAQDISDLIIGKAYLRDNPVPKKWQEPLTECQVYKATYSHANRILETLCPKGVPNQQLLNDILKTLQPEATSVNWNLSSNPNEQLVFSSEDNRYSLRPIEGLLIDKQENNVFLPIEIRHHIHFAALFPKIKRALRISENIYSFIDQHGLKTCVSYDSQNDVLRIEQLDPQLNEWVRFISPDVLTKGHALSSKYLAQEYSHWQPLTNSNKILFKNKKTNVTEYEGSLRSAYQGYIIQSLKRIRDDLFLSYASNRFKHFEDVSYIHEWYDKASENFFHHQSEPNLQETELPRFGLTFKYNARDNSHSCDQFKGFFLAENQHIPKLGSYKNYLVLENEQRERKVLFPQQDFRNNSTGEVLNADFDIERNVHNGSTTQRYITFDITSDGMPVSRSLEANLYLVQVLTAVQEYTLAAQYLKHHGHKHSAYSEREAHILKEICNQRQATKDDDGNAHALRTYAGYLLLKNGASHRHVYTEAITETVVNYISYVDSLRNATVLRLNKREEIFLLTNLSRHGFHPVLFLRLRDLDPVAARAIRIPETKPDAIKSSREASLNESIPNPNWFSGINFSIPDLNDALLTRIELELVNHFPKYYTLAIEGTEKQKAWFYDALSFLVASEKPECVTAANFFMCVLAHSNQFKMPTTRLAADKVTSEQYTELSDWRTAVIATAKSLMEKDSKAEAEKNDSANKNEPKNLTPANFQIEIDAKREKLSVEHDVVPKLAATSWAKSASTWFTKMETDQKFDQSFAEWLKAKGKMQLDVLQTQAYAELKKDFEALQKQKQITFKLKDKITLEHIKTQLEFEKSDGKLEELEKRIVTLANKLPESSKEHSLHFMKTWSGSKKQVTLEEAIVCFARCKINPEALKYANPSLNDNDIQKIYEFVGEYLLVKTKDQQRIRAFETCQKLINLHKSKPDPIAENDLLQQLAYDLSAEHYHNPNSNEATTEPHFLAFEYFAGMMLRHEQVQRINDFLESGDINIVMEMIMGFGKSKVLLPLLALLLKKPLLIVPQSLFENISADTKRILNDAFGRSIHSLHFDRSTTFSKHSLNNLLREITNAQDHGECLIMTSKAFQCLLLKFIEMVGKHFQENEELLFADGSIPLEWSDELTLMQKILNRFEDTRTIIDEADSVLNVLRKVCFSMGDRRPPEAHESRVISEILFLLYDDPAIKCLARAESDPDPKKNTEALTEPIYHEKVKLAIAKAFVARLEGMDLKSPTHTNAMTTFAESLKSESNKELLVNYLCRDENNRANAQKFFNAQSFEVKEILALVGQMISQFLPHTLTRVHNEKYGIDQDSDSSIAVPFLAANTPSKGSQFANRHITMIYTFQAINKGGVTLKMLQNEIERIRTQAMREVREEGSKISIEQTRAWKRFELMRGEINIPLFNSKPEQIAALLNKVNESVDSKRTFVENVIIPQLELYNEQISCNPLNLASFLPSVSGFTGTLWNSMSMHRKIDHKPADGIAAKTLELLFKKCRGDDSIITLNEDNIETMLEQFGKQAYDVIIDAGGYFKQGTNVEVARMISKKFGKHVVFYNSQGEQTITKDGIEMPFAQSSVKESDYITYLDQDHTTGADVKYKRDAVGLVTIGRNMLKRDLSQAPWRLRGLDKLQRPVFALSDDVAAIIRQATGLEKDEMIQIDHITEFTIANQAQQQSRDNFQSFSQQLWDIPQQILLTIMRKEKLTADQYYEIYQELNNLWIKPGMNNSNDLYGQVSFERPAKEIVSEERAQCEKFLKELHVKSPWIKDHNVTLEDGLERIKSLHEHFENSLPETVIHPQQDPEQSTEVEQELQVEAEKEVQMEAQSDIGDEKVELGEGRHHDYLDFDKLTNAIFESQYTPRISLKLFMDQDPSLVSYAGAFTDVDVTLNTFAWPNSKTPSVSSMQLLGHYRTPLHFVDVEGDRVTILNHGDARLRVWSKKPGLYNLTMGHVNQSGKVSLAARKKLLKVKFLNGESFFSAKECKLLEEWFRTYGAEKMRALFVDHILPGFPQKARAYQGSPLQKTLNTLINS